MRKSLPSPPPTPNGGRWVETWRGDDEVRYFSEDGWASITLQLITDKDGRRWEWRCHEVIIGLDRRALMAEWGQSRSDTDGLAGFDSVPVAEPAQAAPEPEPVAGVVPEEYRGRKGRKADPVPVPDGPPEPLPGTLFHGVPEEERGRFRRWLEGDSVAGSQSEGGSPRVRFWTSDRFGLSGLDW